MVDRWLTEQAGASAGASAAAAASDASDSESFLPTESGSESDSVVGGSAAATEAQRRARGYGPQRHGTAAETDTASRGATPSTSHLGSAGSREDWDKNDDDDDDEGEEGGDKKAVADAQAGADARDIETRYVGALPTSDAETEETLVMALREIKRHRERERELEELVRHLSVHYGLDSNALLTPEVLGAAGDSRITLQRGPHGVTAEVREEEDFSGSAGASVFVPDSRALAAAPAARSKASDRHTQRSDDDDDVVDDDDDDDDDDYRKAKRAQPPAKVART